MLDTDPSTKGASGAEAPLQTDAIGGSPAGWRVASGICALADSERHLGHAFQEGSTWLAYDAVHPNATNNGFLCLGHFPSMAEAKFAIEASVGARGGRLHRELRQLLPF